jgi:integrase
MHSKTYSRVARPRTGWGQALFASAHRAPKARPGLSNATVNRRLATLRSIFNLALKWQLFEGRNPAASPGMLPEQHRDKFLTAAETRALVKALDQEPNQDAAPALALLILTGARKQEVLRARWEFVDLDRGVLTVPLSKSGRPRYAPLSPAGVRVLEATENSGQPFRVLKSRPGREAAPGPAEAVGEGEEGRRLADGPAHPRPAPQPGVGPGERGDCGDSGWVSILSSVLFGDSI